MSYLTAGIMRQTSIILTVVQLSEVHEKSSKWCQKTRQRQAKTMKKSRPATYKVSVTNVSYLRNRVDELPLIFE